MPKLNVQQNNQNVIQAFKNALAIGNLKGIIASDGNQNFSTAGSNRNLLDNPFFTVNQRSVTSGTVATGTAEYFVDRWKTAYATYTINSDKSITTSWNGSGLGAYLIQYFAAESVALLEGKTVTLSVDINGSILTKTFAIPTVAGSGVTYQLGTQVWMKCNNVKNSGRGVEIQVYHTFTNGATIRAVKLELGSVSTLANDAPPEYGEELAKCQRYFLRIYGDPIGTGYIASGLGTVFILVPTGVTMRAKPTVSYSGAFSVRVQGSTISVSAMTFATPAHTGGGVGIVCTLSSNAGSVGACAMYPNTTTSYIDLSADL